MALYVPKLRLAFSGSTDKVSSTGHVISMAVQQEFGLVRFYHLLGSTRTILRPVVREIRLKKRFCPGETPTFAGS